MTTSRWPSRLLLPTLFVGMLAGCRAKPTAPAPAPSAAVATTQGADSVTVTGAEAQAVLRGSMASPAARSRDRSVLSRTEIRETQYTNVYDVVLALRGNWVRVRSAESIQGRSSAVQVYLDMQRLTGLDELKSMSPLNILSIRYLDALQASARFGMDHGSGAILVSTAKKN